jgi:membrane-bound lytic murein transglycosylase B
MTPLARIAGAALALLLSLGAARAADEAGFRAWVEAVGAEARQQGISAETLERAFAAAKFNPRVIELDSHQPEFVKPVWDYIAGVVTEDALKKARQKLREHADLLARVQQRYGVPPERIVAIWRIESGFGANFGNFGVVEAS